MYKQFLYYGTLKKIKAHDFSTVIWIWVNLKVSKVLLLATVYRNLLIIIYPKNLRATYPN